MRKTDVLRKSIPRAAPDCRRRSNPAQSIRKKAWWKSIKAKLQRLEELLNESNRPNS